MPGKKNQPHSSGYKLSLTAQERAQRAEQLAINRKPAFKINKAQADMVLVLLKTHTATEVAKLSGLSKATISRIKNGKHRSPIPY